MAKMKNCKSCQAEIPADASKCQYCGSFQRAGFLMAMVLILCAFLMIVWYVLHRESPKKPGPQSAASRAESMCEQAVRKAASHPASIDFSEFGRQPPMKMRGGGYLVRLDFAEKDSLGDKIAKDAICTVKDGKLLSFKKPKP